VHDPCELYGEFLPVFPHCVTNCVARRGELRSRRLACWRAPGEGIFLEFLGLLGVAAWFRALTTSRTRDFYTQLVDFCAPCKSRRAHDPCELYGVSGVIF
jgi:hypothetical protein